MRKQRLTIGCRARILTLKEVPKRTGPNFYANEESWRKKYGGQEVLLKERSGQTFSVMLLGKGITILKKKDPNTVVNQMAWVPEKDMVLVNNDFNTNLDFMDWYEENEANFCPDCLAWFPKRDITNPKTKEDFDCPNKKCPSNHLENYEEDEED